MHLITWKCSSEASWIQRKAAYTKSLLECLLSLFLNGFIGCLPSSLLLLFLLSTFHRVACWNPLTFRRKRGKKFWANKKKCHNQIQPKKIIIKERRNQNEFLWLWSFILVFFSCICKNQQTQKFIEILFDSFIIIILAVCSFCMSDGMVAHELYSVFASVEAVEPFVRLMMNIDSVIACNFYAKQCNDVKNKMKSMYRAYAYGSLVHCGFICEKGVWAFEIVCWFNPWLSILAVPCLLYIVRQKWACIVHLVLFFFLSFVCLKWMWVQKRKTYQSERKRH